MRWLLSLLVFVWASSGSTEVVHDLGLDKKEMELYKDIAYQLRCPTCTGLSVLESDAQFSLQIRDAVREQVLEGKSKQEILDFFTVRYGLWILREPPKEGFHLIAWLIPLAILLLGGALIWMFLWRKRIQPDRAEVITPTHELKQQMQSELAALRGQQGEHNG